jgi:signal transduction histidine kinase
MEKPERNLREMQVRIEELEREVRRAGIQRQAFAQVRDAIWDLRTSDDYSQLVQAIWQALTTLGVPFRYCGINLIDPNTCPAIVIYNMTDVESELEIHEYADGTDQPLIEIWRRQQLAYRPDLQKENTYNEASMLRKGIHSIVDIPFSHGTLAISSEQVDAFSHGDLEAFQYLAGALTGGFRRLQDLRALEERNRDLEREVNERRQAESTIAVSLAVQRVRNESLRIERSEDWHSVVDTCHREIKTLIDCDGFSINFVDLAEDTFYNYIVGVDGAVSKGDSIVGIPLALRETIEQNAAVYRRNSDEIARKGGRLSPERHSIVDVPFNGGTVAISSKREDAFSARDIAALLEFGQVISEAVRRLRDVQLLDSRERQLRQAQTMEAIGQLTAGIAHNFNNMLQGIMGNIFLATQEAASVPQREMLESADLAARRAAAMVRQLLTFAHPGSQRRVESIEPSARLADVLEMGQRTFDRRIELTLEVEADLPEIEMDVGQFEQIALNVLINARDAVADLQERTPHIHVAMDKYIDADTDRAYLRIRTEDNGIGMDEKTSERIFEPFFTTKPVDKGTGLGLSTVYSIVQKQGGRIDCESQLGVGTIFSVFLPLLGDSARQVAAIDPEALVGGVVLVIDDEDSVRNSTMNILQYYGYEVRVASDGIEGLELFRQERPDLVLLDLSMPRMSGREVLKEMRQIDPHIKVLLFTGYATDEEEFGHSVGVVHKPFMAADLIAAITQAMQAT